MNYNHHVLAGGKKIEIMRLDGAVVLLSVCNYNPNHI